MLGLDFTSTTPPRWFRPWWWRRFENQTVEEARLASSTPSQTSLSSRPGSSDADDTPGCRKHCHPCTYRCLDPVRDGLCRGHTRAGSEVCLRNQKNVFLEFWVLRRRHQHLISVGRLHRRRRRSDPTLFRTCWWFSSLEDEVSYPATSWVISLWSLSLSLSKVFVWCEQ